VVGEWARGIKKDKEKMPVEDPEVAGRKYWYLKAS
jgi:hypothetical protein